MTGREIIINYFKRHQSGTKQQICNTAKAPLIISAKVGCALHDMVLREELKMSSGVYELEESVDAHALTAKPAKIKCSSHVPRRHFGGNNYLTQLLKVVRS